MAKEGVSAIKKKASAVVIAALIILYTVIAVVLLPFVFADETAAASTVLDRIAAVRQYDDETVITLSEDISFEGNVTFGSAKAIRFVSDTENASRTLVFNGGLTVESEANIVFDVDVAVENNSEVYGTLTVNKKLYNKGTFTVSNVKDDYAEMPSEGVIVGGSFNNDAQNGGALVISDGATLTVRESSEYTVTTVDDNVNTAGEKTFGNNDAGALMLRSDGTSLGLTNNGTIINNGTVVYDDKCAAPSVNSASTGVVAGATFVAAASNNFTANFTSANATYVVYPTDPATTAALTAYPSTVVDLSSSVTLGRAVNILSFGKVTYKLNANNINFTINADVNLGGGNSGSKFFTQGANELIFDGGAVWNRGSAVSYGTTTQGIIFFDEADNEAYYYTNNNGYGFSSGSGTSAFFNVSSSRTFSIFGGVKITDFMSVGRAAGGALYINGATFNMYGGELSRCAVGNISNGSVGAGIYLIGNGRAFIYGGKVTRNGAGTYGTGGEGGSADGSGVAVTGGSRLYLYGGEISYNHSALGGGNMNADGGGIMLDSSTAYIYGGAVRGNFAGGSGGGVCAWQATLYMTGGEISENRAAYGGGIGTTAPTNNQTNVYISGGSILNNEAFQNHTSDIADSENWGGYGGGICLGSALNEYGRRSYLTISGDTLVSGNKAYYGGGLAVYSKSNSDSNQLTMQGGLISGNAAYALPSSTGYQAVYNGSVSANGGGVYVNGTGGAIQRAMLLLSGDASIDSSNSVSFDVAATSTAYAPIQIDGDLTGSGLGALVYLGSDTIDSKWTSTVPVIQASVSGHTASEYLNKFVLDTNADTLHWFGVGTGNTNNIYVQSGTSTVTAASALARIRTGGSDSAPQYAYYATLADAVAGAPANASTAIEILKSATLATGQIIIDNNKNITIRPAVNNGVGRDVSLVISSTAAFTGDSLFRINGGASLTLDASEGTGSRLTVDGNGTGRHLENENAKAISLVEVYGTYTQKSNVYLRNNITGSSIFGSAVVVSGTGVFDMQGGVIEDNTARNTTSGSAVYLQGTATFNWTGGKIQNNVTGEENDGFIDYAVYLSTNNNILNINSSASAEESGLTDNVIYVGNAKINAVDMTGFVGTVGLVLPDVTSLQAGTVVVSMGGADYSGKFELAQEQEGLELGKNDAGDLIIWRTVTYIIDMRYADGVNMTDNGITKGNDEKGDNIAEYLTNSDALTNSEGQPLSGITVGTRQNGYVVTVSVRSDTSFPGAALREISNFYSRNGYFTDGYAGGALSYSFDSSLAYQRTNAAINLNVVWSQTVHNIVYNSNAPAGVGENNVSGSLPTLKSITHNDLTDTAKNVISTDISIVGYAFSGWNTRSDGTGVQLFGAYKYGETQRLYEADLINFTDTTTRGTNSIIAYAQWTPIFGGGVGSQLSPFVLSESKHIENLYKANDGEAIELTENITYPAKSASAVNGCMGYYFVIGNATDALTLEVAANGYELKYPFKGNLNGNLNTIKLNGKPLFGEIEGANISGIVFEGAVSGSGNVGALAGRATSSTVTQIANRATVTGTDGASVAGGIVGSMNGGSLEYSFNYAKITSQGTAGGLVGKDEGGRLAFSYNTGAVEGATAGGLAGDIVNAEISSSFNGSSVTGGAIAGNYTSNVTFTRVYFNTDRASFTHSDVRGLTSSKMYVSENGVDPIGLTGSWAYELCNNNEEDPNADVYFYYPQISVFHDSEKTVELSRASVTLLRDNDRPVTPDQKFTVTYDANGGVFSDGTTVKTYEFGLGDTLTQPEDPTRVGYSFVYWCTDKEGNDRYDFEGGVSANDVTIYAKWEEIRYEIRYSLNDVTNQATISGNYNRYVTVSNTPDDRVLLATAEYVQRPGYEFTGWTYAQQFVTSIAIENDNIVMYFSDEKLDISVPIAGITSLDLYANWSTVPYTIAYRSIGVTTADTIVYYNNRESYEVIDEFALNNASAVGYRFVHWTTDPADADDTQIISLISGRHENLTLYAVFEPLTYKISFNPVNGTIPDEIKSDDKYTLDGSTGLYYGIATYGEAPSDLFFEAERIGYTFDGWYRTLAGENEFSFDMPYTISDNITLYAMFTASKFDVTVNAGAGSFSAAALNAIEAGLPSDWVMTKTGDAPYSSYVITVSYGANVLEFLATPEVATGIFSGWEVVTENGGISNVTADVTVTAQYSGNITVIFSYDGKTVAMIADPVTNKISYTDPEDLNDKTGYEFIGWFGNVAGEGKPADFDVDTFTTPTVLYAKYEPKTVTVTFEPGDPFEDDDKVPAFTAPSTSFNYESVLDGSIVPTYDGYRFTGWYAGDVPAAGVALGNLELTESGDGYAVTLAAHWEEEEYKISFNVEGGSPVADVTYTYAQTFKKFEVTAVSTRDGYTFKGWDGLDGAYLPEGSFGDKTLTAKWEIIKYTVTYRAGLGSFGITDGGYSADGKTFTVTVDHGAVAPRPVNPSLEGHSF